MENFPPVGCVIMASGLSRRFGSNKLLAPFDGQPLLCRAFAATDTPQLAARIVVTRWDAVRSLCSEQGVPVLLHDLPGRNDTVKLGLSALLEQTPDLAGCFFLPGDQPLLWEHRSETTLLPLPEAPFCSEKAILPSFSPCRRARAEAYCSKNTLQMFTHSVWQSHGNCWTQILPRRWHSWKSCCKISPYPWAAGH